MRGPVRQREATSQIGLPAMAGRSGATACCRAGRLSRICSRPAARAHGRFGTIPSSHLGRVRLDLMPAFPAPNDQPNAGGGSIAERHRRAEVGLHFGSGASGPAPMTARMRLFSRGRQCRRAGVPAEMVELVAPCTGAPRGERNGNWRGRF
jgi:hypothetical protein